MKRLRNLHLVLILGTLLLAAPATAVTTAYFVLWSDLYAIELDVTQPPVVREVGPLSAGPGYRDVDALAFDGAGRLLMVSREALYEVDPETAAADLIGLLELGPLARIRGLAFDADGALWLLALPASGPNRLFVVDPESGVASARVEPDRELWSITFREGELVAAGAGAAPRQMQFYTVDPATGSTSLIAESMVDLNVAGLDVGPSGAWSALEWWDCTVTVCPSTPITFSRHREGTWEVDAIWQPDEPLGYPGALRGLAFEPAGASVVAVPLSPPALWCLAALLAALGVSTLKGSVFG